MLLLPTLSDARTDGGCDKHSEAYIRQRIATIYETVGKQTDDGGNLVDYIHSSFNIDSAYCSRRYYALMQEALQLCNEMGTALYDYDHWIRGQDFDDTWRYTVKRVYSVTDSTALVDMTVHNFSARDASIALRFERDDWFIDDFEPSSDGNDDQSYLRQTIAEGYEAREKAKPLAGTWVRVGADGPELLLSLEMTEHGLKVLRCDVNRQFAFDNASATFDGDMLCVSMTEWDSIRVDMKYDLNLLLRKDSRGDLKGTCRIVHPLADKDYDCPVTLRKATE